MDTQQLKLFKVLLIGDSCIDKYHYGTCDRISPEAPVPILNFKETTTPTADTNYAKIYSKADNRSFIGYLDEIRLSIGVARWTSGFTVY